MVGACGYLGRHVVEALRPLAPIIAATDGRCTEKVILEIPRNPEAWSLEQINEVRGSVVVYAAGHRPPATSFDENVTELGLLLRVVEPRRIVLVSSNAAAFPETPYGWSKWAQERVVVAHALERGANARVARLVHLYGDAADEPSLERLSVVDRWIRQARQGAAIRCAEDVAFDMLHVADAARALADMALRVRQFGSLETWDVGSGQAWRLDQLGTQIALAAGVPLQTFDGDPVTFPVAGQRAKRWTRTGEAWTPSTWARAQLEA